MTNHIHKYFKFHKPSPLHSSREWRVCIGAEREYSLSLLTQQQPAPVQHLMPAFIVETAYKFATCSYDPYQAQCTMRFQKKRAKNDEKLQFMIWDSKTPQVAYKDGTQVRHIRSSSHQPVNIVSFHNHLHKSDINEVIKGSLWVLFQWRSLVLPQFFLIIYFADL